MSGFGVGIVLGLSSPATFQLRAQQQEALNNSAQLNNSIVASQDMIVMTSAEISLFSAVYSCGALAGGLLSSALMNRLGRRATLMVSVLPCLLGCCLMGLSSNYGVLLTGRILTGVFIGVSGASGNAFLGEIAASDIRGMLGALYELMLVAGVLIAFVTREYVSWQQLALITNAPVLLLALLVFFTKESPAFLLIAGKENEARAALQYYRGPDRDVDMEMCALKESQMETRGKRLALSDLKKRHIYLPLFITVVTASMFHLCGIGMSTKTNMSEATGVIACCGVELITAVAAIFLIERAGRKTLLLVSGAVMSASFGCLGLYFYFLSCNELWAKQHLSWLPLTSLLAYVVAFGIGYGPIPWILLGEMFPPLIRETAAGLTVTVVWTLSFITIVTYDALSTALGSYGFYWLYASICALASIFTAAVVKETKGKRLDEITKLFESKKSYGCSTAVKRIKQGTTTNQG
ncbi:solute carrier family 2, facilitated glucose transporter member 8-like [Hyalella azteca]|uniref:Solute carrier family 2, facilitated glucose transporter member 8-like n=1 Tax=Hyalella azteca TaxID=294128 RepID=A0A979FHU5_HYAAZ|nr:solute carrier family 2, facilitated glucose transporter member 8-like [Hyalella azteca]